MCQWYEIEIEPRDVLFFRGAKPMGASSIGEGCQWPMPSVFHHALLSACHERWPEPEGWEHEHKKRADEKGSCRFGGLQSVGVFPRKGAELYLPTPADIQYHDDQSEEFCLLQPRTTKGRGDMPRPLKKALFKDKDSGPTKKKPGEWMSYANIEKYLKGDVSGLLTIGNDELFDRECRPGIGIDPQSHSAEEGKFYLAEYLRLKTGVTLKGLAVCQQSRVKGGAGGDVFERFFESGQRVPFIFGGQRGVANLEHTREPPAVEDLINREAAQSRFIKWVLLTPAIFTDGWLPCWIGREDGEIKALKKPIRHENESRSGWRKRCKDEGKSIPGRLVAAKVPKPIPYSGWRAHGGADGDGGARPTRLCVPAGAVYYFEVPRDKDPKLLMEFLNGKRKSDMGAEKGFGFGLCGNWNGED